MQYTIDCANISSKEELHRVLAETLHFPAHYGRNLDALYDCLGELSQKTHLILQTGIMLLPLQAVSASSSTTPKKKIPICSLPSNKEILPIHRIGRIFSAEFCRFRSYNDPIKRWHAFVLQFINLP